ncbi:aquaporin-9-like isoform X2 [Heptranchias perlo]|uniref:aquaporin-9-like isoform X2 n=1 Tax=Heptranchias perlo TaxID=212740 RepID=UPI00355990BD
MLESIIKDRVTEHLENFQLIRESQHGFVKGAHLNPAISLSMCVLGRLQWLKLPVYCIAQFVGAFIGSAAVFGLYYDAFMAFDGGNLSITGQNATAQIFSSYPAPHLSFANGFADQIVGTAALLFSILAILDSKNDCVPKGLEPVVIGLIIMVIGLSMGFNCGGTINPARDLGPRLFTAVAGWGFEVFSAGDGWWWVPVIAPMIGGVLGTSVYVLIIELHHKEPIPEESHCSTEQQIEGKAKYEMISVQCNK